MVFLFLNMELKHFLPSPASLFINVTKVDHFYRTGTKSSLESYYPLNRARSNNVSQRHFIISQNIFAVTPLQVTHEAEEYKTLAKILTSHLAKKHKYEEVW